MTAITVKVCGACHTVFNVGYAAKNCKKCGKKGSLIQKEGASPISRDKVPPENAYDANGVYVGVDDEFVDHQKTKDEARSVNSEYWPGADDTAKAVTISVPVDHVTVGFPPMTQVMVNFKAKYHERPRAFIRGALSALTKAGTKLSTGKPVKNHGDVVVWIFEQLADNCDLPLTLGK